MQKNQLGMELEKKIYIWRISDRREQRGGNIYRLKERRAGKEKDTMGRSTIEFDLAGWR